MQSKIPFVDKAKKRPSTSRSWGSKMAMFQSEKLAIIFIKIKIKIKIKNKNKK